MSPYTTPTLPSARAKSPGGASSPVRMDAVVCFVPSLIGNLRRPPLDRKAGLISLQEPGEYRAGAWLTGARNRLEHQGFKSGGKGGSSRIKVIVTRRFGDKYGSSGNRGSVSAFPATIKIFPDGTPSASRIWRTALARSAESSHGP